MQTAKECWAKAQRYIKKASWEPSQSQGKRPRKYNGAMFGLLPGVCDIVPYAPLF